MYTLLLKGKIIKCKKGEKNAKSVLNTQSGTFMYLFFTFARKSFIFNGFSQVTQIDTGGFKVHRMPYPKEKT